jgi:hypothetical protein
VTGPDPEAQQGSQEPGTGAESGTASPVDEAGVDDGLTRRSHNRTTRFVWGAVIVILIGVIAIVIDALAGPATATRSVRRSATSDAVLTELAHIPASVFDAVGVTPTDSPVTAPTLVDGSPLVSSGKPEVLYVGAEFCPFCAAERWALVVALSRFGRFTALSNMQSAPQSVFPGTQSFSFVDSAYSSRLVTFTGVELYSDTQDSHGVYTRLGRLTPSQAVLVARYSATGTPGRPSGGASPYPFVDVANVLVAPTSGFSPAVLAGLSQSAVAGALDQPTEPSTQAIVASANFLTAGICRATHGQPAAVCTSRAVRTATAALTSGVSRPPGT